MHQTITKKNFIRCFLRKLDRDEVKVAQLQVLYQIKRHTITVKSLNGAIVGMAQNMLVNNINILSHLVILYSIFGGKDAASPRYIWTSLPEHTTISLTMIFLF